MKFFDWLKPRDRQVELDTTSALAHLLETGDAFLLEPGTHVVPVPTYPEAQRIADSLRDFPEDWAWKHKGYTLKHVPSGFMLWVANKDYGLGEDHGSHQTAFAKPEQAIIWPAVEAWLKRFKVGFSGRPVKPRITPFEGRYFCESAEHPWRGFGKTADEAYRSWLAAVSVKARGQMPKGEVLTVWSAAK